MISDHSVMGIPMVMWRDSTEVERRAAELKVPGSNPGGGATKIIRSFHNLLRIGLMGLFVCSTCCSVSQRYGVLNPYENGRTTGDQLYTGNYIADGQKQWQLEAK